MAELADLDWDHIRVFLVTMRSNSLRRAADRLRLSHPTARRRLNALEEQLGIRLFDRRPDGLHPTKEALDLQHAAEEVERAMQSLERVAQAADPELRGVIRVALPEILATDLLMDDFAAFTQRWPQIELQLDASYDIADLSKREADVALRAMPAGRPPEEHLAGRLAATMYSSVYGQGDCWIGWRGAERDAEWVRDTEFPDLPVRGAMNDGMLQRGACAAGLGLTILPCFFAEPLLERRTTPKAAFDLWVLVHPDLRRSARLKIFRDAIVEAIKTHRPRLEGRA